MKRVVEIPNLMSLMYQQTESCEIKHAGPIA